MEKNINNSKAYVWMMLLAILLASNAGAEESLCAIPTIEAPQEFGRPDGDIEFRARQGSVSRDGDIAVNGDVEIIQDDVYVRADEARFSASREEFSVSGDVEYRDSKMSVTGQEANFSGKEKSARFAESEFVMPETPARGSAGEFVVDDKSVSMSDVTYTTCPLGNNDWLLKAGSLEIDEGRSRGVARNVQIRFRDVPLIYLPYLSFPTNDERKSGLLFPAIGTSSRGGAEVALPYYWNIAPNYDLTYTPHYLNKRGLQHQSEFRYLWPRSEGTLDIDFLSKDKTTNRRRSYGLWQHETLWANGWRGLSHIESVSDSQYFEDFGRGVDATSRTAIERNLQLDYLNQLWQITIRAQNFRTVDTTIAPVDQPYQRLPQFLARGRGKTRFSNLAWQFDGELVNFQRDVGVTGQRINLRPGLSYPMGGAGYYLTPKLELDYTAYRLGDLMPGQNESPSRTTPITTVDSGLIFERDLRSDSGLVQTLEPRIFYAHIPFRNQASLPVFDTEMPTFNLVELYRANRFVGADRLGDTDQVSVGVTTRLLDETQGRQVLSATLGQAFFLSDREVTLPNQPLPLQSNSQVIAELDLSLYRKWNMDLVHQWDPGNKKTAISQFRVQYLPGDSSVINLAYRYQNGLLEESDLSFVTPISRRWDLIGRLNYSLLEESTIEQLVGVEYKSCCWNFQLVSRRYVSRRDGRVDSSILFQFELKGLSKVGSGAESALRNGILGYPED